MRRVLAVCVPALCLLMAAVQPGAAAVKSRTPIRHFVVLMQQDRSFDHYFGTYKRADGLPRNVC